MNKIQGLCHVLHYKDYYKFQPMIEHSSTTNSSLQFHDADKDVYVCESRYNPKTKIVKKIKWWNVPENQRVKLIPRETILEPIRESLPLENPNNIHRQVLNETELTSVEIIEKSIETIPYDSVINDKLNENSMNKKQFYEQIVVSSSCYYKMGDYVYIHKNSKKNDQPSQRSIFRIDQIWKNNE